jgi:hypothetical protein
MADQAETVITPAVSTGSTARGDVPDRIQRRYLTETRSLNTAFYIDATAPGPAFRDHGSRLRVTRNDPNVIRDVVAIAAHRGWSGVTVQGEARFRREAWLAGRIAGLEVRGYRPTERDEQDLSRRQAQRERYGEPDRRAPRDPPSGPAAPAQMRVVEAVVRNRVVARADQDRVLTAARARIAGWLERGARFEEIPARRRSPVHARGPER